MPESRSAVGTLMDHQRNKVVSAAEAVLRLVRPGDALATGGFVGIGYAEALAIELEEHFLDTQAQGGTPLKLTLLYADGQGDDQSRGPNHLAHPGLVKRAIDASAARPLTPTATSRWSARR